MSFEDELVNYICDDIKKRQEDINNIIELKDKNCLDKKTVIQAWYIFIRSLEGTNLKKIFTAAEKFEKILGINKEK